MKRLISVFTRVSVQFLSSLLLLGRTLRCEYFVLSLDFQRIGSESFKADYSPMRNTNSIVHGILRLILMWI